jgi:hypothetical protein
MSHVPAGTLFPLPAYIFDVFLVPANIKSLPALNMILRAQEDGQITSDTHTLVEYSSGSTITSIGLIANILGIPRVKAYVTNKTTVVKLQLLQFFVSFLFAGQRVFLIQEAFFRDSMCLSTMLVNPTFFNPSVGRCLGDLFILCTRTRMAEYL